MEYSDINLQGVAPVTTFEELGEMLQKRINDKKEEVVSQSFISAEFYKKQIKELEESIEKLEQQEREQAFDTIMRLGEKYDLIEYIGMHNGYTKYLLIDHKKQN